MSSAKREQDASKKVVESLREVIGFVESAVCQVEGGNVGSATYVMNIDEAIERLKTAKYASKP